jgi:hypothetical protein
MFLHVCCATSAADGAYPEPFPDQEPELLPLGLLPLGLLLFGLAAFALRMCGTRTAGGGGGTYFGRSL